MGIITDILFGGVIKQFTDPLNRAYEARLNAKNDEDRMEADLLAKKLEGARDIALAEAHDRWSAVRVGRFLIVVPYGIWWAAIFLIQILNPWFGWNLVVIDVPPQINEMARYLIPAILLGDVSMGIGRMATRARKNP